MNIVIAVGLAICANGVELRPGAVEVVSGKEPCGAVDFAAQEMSEFLGKAFGAAVPVVEAPTGSRVPVILGSNDWSRAAGIDTAALDRDEFVIKAVDGKVFVAGRDVAGSRQSLKFARERATLFGVYELLYRYAGVRMYFPGELGTIVPKAASITVPDGEIRVKPSYTIRRYGPKDGTVPKELLASAGAKTEFDFKHLNKLRQRLGTLSIPCCHGQLRSRFYKRFHETHPEYFIMGKDGKRHPTEALTRPLYKKEHMCHTSAIWDEIYEDAKAYLTGQPPEVRKIPSADGKSYVKGPGSEGKYYDVMPHDGLGQCWCKSCQARMDHTKKQYATELLWSNTVSVARRLKEAGVKGYITQMAYHPYADVPEIEIPDNVMVMVAQKGPWARPTPERDANIKAWAKKTGGKVWLWTYPDKIFERSCPDIPQMSPHAWGNYFKSVSDYIFGGFGESESDRWIYNHLNYYVFSRVCWDVNVDVDAVLDEYYSLMFGKAAPKIKAIFESLEEKWVGKMMHNVRFTDLGPETEIPGWYDVWARIYSPEALAEYARLFDEAAASVAPGSLEARRIALFRSEFLDPLAARAKDAHDSFNVEKSLARRAAYGDAEPAFLDDPASGIDKWKRHPKSGVEISRSPEKGPASSAPVVISVSAKGALAWRPVKLRAGAKYRFSYFMKLDGLEAGRYSGFNCYLKCGDKDVKFKRGDARYAGTTGWIYLETEYETPEDMKRGTGMIFCRFPSDKGKVFLDGLRIDEIADPRTGGK